MNKIKLKEKRKIAKDSMEFTFEKPPDLVFMPGQFVEINIVHPDEPGKKISRELSFVTAPHEEVLTFGMRMRGSLFKRTLEGLRVGDGVTMDGPFGAFLLHNDSSRPAVFLAGGIGIAPFVSMLRDAAYYKLPHEIYLFYSNHTVEDAAYLEELEGHERDDPNFTFIPTLTGTAAGKSWQGMTGRINADMLRKWLPDLQRSVFYIAGSAAFVAAMKKLLSDAGVNNDSIRMEEFAGYV